MYNVGALIFFLCPMHFLYFLFSFITNFSFKLSQFNQYSSFSQIIT